MTLPKLGEMHEKTVWTGFCEPTYGAKNESLPRCSACLVRSLRLPDPNSEMILYPNDMDLEPSPRPGRTAARLARQVELALAEVDLSLPQYRILIHLDEGKVAASTLADKIAVSRPSVTAVVDGLVTRGLVERHHDPGDRRRVGHDLTTEGRRLLEKADEFVDGRLLEIASAIRKERAENPLKALDRWRVALDAYRSHKRDVQPAVEVVRAK
jgi:DNA-binding MarR family transcriptional regulator